MGRDRRLPLPGSLAGPKAPPASATTKIGPISVDRTGSSRPTPAAQGSGDSRTQAFTYIATPPKPGEQTPILYNGDRLWVRVTLILETAGPVAVGQMSALSPVLSGKGILLTTNIPIVITIAKGNRLYVLANAVSRIKVVVEPLPWLEQITGLLHGGAR